MAQERRRLSSGYEHQAYVRFMQEYEALQHMEQVTIADENPNDSYYIPHHAVFKSDGSRKIRVVFNASQPASNGLSLNDCLLTGPKLQTDISTIITRSRIHRFVFSADIVKIFRQFLIHHEDRRWLRILWRPDPTEAIQHYNLKTVTYGTACAPFQAIRILRQLAADERANFPLGAEILELNTYVDDSFAGADTLESALNARDQLVSILKTAGMELDKWTANHPDLQPVAEDDHAKDRLLLDKETVSTLGIRWNPIDDIFCFLVEHQNTNLPTTKRELLSMIARLFDPMGWLGPVLIRAKIMVQQLWIRGCDWDSRLDQSTLEESARFCQELKDVEKIAIPRYFGGSPNSRWFLHGFADASSRAYAAVLYFVTTDTEDQWRSTIIAAKSKVAPVKTISIPHLELCAAVLLTKLIASLLPQLRHKPDRVFCWSDSTVTLAWLKEHPSRWQTFVANRVSEILTQLPQASWNHVRTHEDPADAASRGLSPQSLKESSLWWHGPSWLPVDWRNWTSPGNFEATSLEERTSATVLTHKVQQVPDLHLTRFSQLNRLYRTYAYVLRWSPLHRKQYAVRPGEILQAEEIVAAERCLLRMVQRKDFALELAALKRQESLPRTSYLLRCCPFLDEYGVMRVGGRLQNFALSFKEKHPALVSRHSHLTTLIIRDAHLRTLHGGPQLVLSYLRRKFWIPQVRTTLRRLVRSCVRCTRFQGRCLEQQMAPLPAAWGEVSRPFTTCGLDYASPFPVRTTKGRGYKSTKGYVCVFVCFATRAVHLEVVSDLTTQSFLAAYRRFTSRRGLCKIIYSDNGTTFKGADQELAHLFSEASSFSQSVASSLAGDGVMWRFIPPRGPHFGGLWEAGVKSFKHHFKRVLGESLLTFEEFTTLASQIEACLNSRPLSPLSTNVEDLTALTRVIF